MELLKTEPVGVHGIPQPAFFLKFPFENAARDTLRVRRIIKNGVIKNGAATPAPFLITP